MKTWFVYWCGGERDGEILGAFPDMWEAEKFATKVYMEHADEFDPCTGGIGIEDELGNVDIDW